MRRRRSNDVHERDDRRRGAGPDDRGPQGRADVRHGRVPAAAVLRRRAPARARRTTSSTTSAAAPSRPTPTPRSSGRVGLVDATLGPGATNLVTGLVEALNAGTPMVAIVGDTHRAAFLEEHDPGMRARPRSSGPPCKELIRIEHDEPHPRADAPRLRGRDLGPAGAGRARRAGGRLPRRRCRFDGRGFRRRPGATRRRRRCAAGRTAPRHRARRGAARRGPAPARAGRRRRPHVAAPPTRCTRFADAPSHSGRAHDDRQGRDRLHRPAQRRPVRPLRPHRQRR